MRNEISIEVLVLKRLRELAWRRQGKIIPFPDVFARVCSILCLTKEEAWEVLRSMEEKRLIKIVPYYGIKLLSKNNSQY